MALIDSLVTDLQVTAFWQGQEERFDHHALVTAAPGNRWNLPGDPAVYLAGDMGVALVEAGRHKPASSLGETVDGIVWNVEVQADRILDLRQDDVRAAFQLDEPHWFLDRRRCQGLVAALRAEDVCSGIMAQSAGLADDPARWNLVLFADRLRRPLTEALRHPRRVGSFRLGAVEQPIAMLPVYSFDLADR